MIYERARAVLRSLPKSTSTSEGKWLEAAISQVEAYWTDQECRNIPANARPIDRLAVELSKLKIKTP
jgi:hypothetical protein